MSSLNLFTILLFSLFVLTLQVAFASNTTSTTTSLKTYKAYIKNACNSTTYPKFCYHSLSPYASKIKKNSIKLTKISISLAVKVSRNSSSTLRKLSKLKGLMDSEYAVVRVCRENIDDTVDELKKCLIAVKGLNGTSTGDEKFQWSNIKTWMSAAITNEGTCTDESDEMQVRTVLQRKIKTSVANIATMTSVALALVNKLTHGM